MAMCLMFSSTVRPKLYLVAAAFLFIAVPIRTANAQLVVEVIDDQQLVDVQTVHTIDAVISHMFDVYVDDFQLPYELSFKVKLRFFDNFVAFKDYQSAFSKSRSNNGFYSPQRKEGVIWQNKTETRMLSTALHEASHVLLRNRVPQAPHWIDEGLAEYFENASVLADTLVISPHEDYSANMKRWLREGSLISLRSYIRLSNRQWGTSDKHGQSKTRMIAWSLVSFLMSNDSGKETIRQVLHSFATKKHDKLSRVDVIDQTFPGGIDALETQWHRWIAKQS